MMTMSLSLNVSKDEEADLKGRCNIVAQVLGSCCFITAAVLFMLETQLSWWRIRPLDLGWNVGFWNFVGGMGFWLW